MIAYLYILLIFFILNFMSFLYRRKEIIFFDNKKIDIFYYLFIIIIFVFSAFRYNVGWDYEQYYWTIVYNLDTNIVSRGELLTIGLVELSRNLGIANIYFFLNSFLTIFLVALVIDNYSKDKWMSILVFIAFPLFFLNSLSVIRFFSALAIVFFSIKYIKEKNFFKYIIAINIAALFHSSALLALILYFFVKQKIGKVKILIFTLMAFFSSNILNILVSMYFPQYSVYTEKTSVKEGTLAIYFFVIILVVALPIINKINENYYSRIYFNAFFFGFLIYIAFFGQGSMSHRLSLFGTLFCVLLIPQIIEFYFKDLRIRLIILYIVYVLFSVIFIYSVGIGAETYIPYKTIFSLN